MCKPAWKKRLLAVLVLLFVVQSSLVYSDSWSEPLSADAVVGRKLWHRHACQTCHQLYGQGGFLGPDLTNAASRVDSMTLVSLLQVGSGQMPPIGLDESEISAMLAFLEAMDQPEIGRGQLRLGNPEKPGGLQAGFEEAIAGQLDRLGAETARVGFEAIRTRPCASCHLPFRTSTAGAPDLSTVAERLTGDSLRQVLRSGRPDRGMPQPVPPFAPDELEAVVAYLEYLNERRDELQSSTSAVAGDRRIDWRRLPWWEFP